MAAAHGIYKIHRRGCPAFRNATANCTCGKKATWQAHVPAKRKGGKPMRKHFKTRAEAIEWRDSMGAAVVRGEVIGSRSTLTVGEAADKLIDGMRAGTVVDRSARRFKPSTIRGYARSVDKHLPRWFLRLKLRDVQRDHVLKVARDWRTERDGKPLSPSTVHNRLDVVRLLFREARRDNIVGGTLPTADLGLEAPRGSRERVATPEEARALIGGLPESERALWTTAFYTGLRLGELRALRWDAVDFDRKRIAVVASWDDVEGRGDPKTDAGTRVVPMGQAHDFLAAHWGAKPTAADSDLVFGRSATQAFVKSTTNNRAKAAWKRADLPPITLHECRHSRITWWANQGIRADVIKRMAGHSSITVTIDRYGHAMPDDLDETADLDAQWLATRDGKVTEADGVHHGLAGDNRLTQSPLGERKTAL